ncbi:pectinesterase family protein [Saccharicrinis sp. FJH62]|uniref:pectinesterase family protein n=1 Tax=Saccharicrinis sp. FJH62 TaxID=3344657 RepID=UPI0035D4538F
MIRSIFIILILQISLAASVAQVFDIVVDPEGAGDFTNITDAINAVPDNASQRTLIFVKSGVYHEKIWLASAKANVSIIGEDVESVILDWDDYQGRVVNGSTISGADSYTFLAEGTDLYMENITVKNSAGPVGQAVAIRTIGDRSAFKNCHFLGNQDTYYAHKRRQYNYKCTIEGNTDYIYGDATNVFDSCTIRSIPGGSYITAPADAKLITHFASGNFYHGLLFRYCDVTAASGVADHSVYLGRPWQPNASSVYIECTLGSHIKPEGWSTWSDDNHLTSYFAEYQNETPEGNLVDVSQRVSWSYQLSETQLNRYALKFFLHNSDNIQEYWDPLPAVTPLYDPQNVQLSGNQLTWDLVPEAVGYVIYFQGSVIGFAEENTFSVTEGINIPEDFKVVSVDDYGALSDGSVPVNTALDHIMKNERDYSFINKKFELPYPVDIDVFDMNGRKLTSVKHKKSCDFSGFPSGIYMIRVEEASGRINNVKILNN